LSQAGDIDITGTHPDIPTEFQTDDGTAVPIANVLEFLGEAVVAHSIPVETTGSGNTVTIAVQIADEVAASDVSKVGLAAFDSTGFTVDANGFVTLNGGGGATTNINVDASTAPGTDPVVPSAGVITMTGGQVASGVVGTNVIRTDSLAANTLTIEIQRSTAVAATDITKNGVSHFDSAAFAVDANGFVTLAGGGLAIDSIALQTGTSPIAPTAGGLVTFNGAVVAAGTNPIRSNGTGANTAAIEVQISQAIAATDATKIGLCNFDSSKFTVDANGFVSTSGTGVAQTITGTSGGALPPTAGNWNILGSSTAAGTSPVNTSGSGSTLTVNVQKSQAIAATDATKVGLCNFNSTQFSVDANGFVALAGGGLAIDSIHPDSGTDPVVPTAAGLVNIIGSGSTTTVGSLNTLTVQLTGLTNHALLIGAGTTTITKLGAGSTGQILQTNTTADPTWSTATYPSTATGTGTILRADGTNWLATTATYPNTTTINRVLYSSANNTISEITTAIDGVMITSHTGVPSILANSGTPGWVLTANSGAPPSWQAAGGGASASDYTQSFLLGGM